MEHDTAALRTRWRALPRAILWAHEFGVAMGTEQLALTAVAAIGRRPKLAATLFRFQRWGNPFADERWSYPYPMFDRIRSDGPVVYAKTYRQWFVTGHDEAQEVLKSPDTTSAEMRELILSLPQYKKLSEQARSNFSRWLLTNDGTDHARLRSAVSRAFTPRQVVHYEALAATVASELIAALPRSGEVDIVAAFNDHYPIQVIAALLGLPAERGAWLHAASREIGAMVEPLTGIDPVSLSRRFAELDDYVSEVIEQRRLRPGDDLISALVCTDAETASPTLTHDEIVAVIAMLLFAGHETISSVLGNAIVALARFPEQRALLRDTPTLLDNAVEELLRFDTSAVLTARKATADMMIGGQRIHRGQNIGVFIGAANRDPRRWPDANELRLDRTDPRPLSFGFGAHYCVGAALARLELRLALPLLLSALRDYAVDESRITWRRSFSLRGPLSLPVRIGA